jgi:hypothetical protein
MRADVPSSAGRTTPRSSWRAPPAAFAWLALLAALAALARALGPAALRHLPTCPLHEWTGYFCPGCGTTRAVYHLLRGEVLAACSANALVVLSLGAAPLAWLMRPWLTPRLRRLGPRARGAVVLAAGVLVVLFGILRNLHASPFAWLAP